MTVTIAVLLAMAIAGLLAIVAAVVVELGEIVKQDDERDE